MYVENVALRWSLPARRWPAILLLAWGALNLVGGVATVLPLPILAFHPSRSLRHYSFHALYAVAQLPLLWLAWMETGRVAAERPGAD